jgi:CelD/BcsL family acetyltransferase involved in cellulose biosynthesis
LVRSWRRLEASAALPTQSLSFASALSRTLLADQDIDVIFAQEGAGLAGLIAFCGKRTPFARWRMIGPQELWEPTEALCRDGGAAQLLAEAVVGDGRALQMDRIPAGSPLIPALRSALKGKGLMWGRSAIPTPTIALDEGWKDPASRFNSGRRSDFRRAARKAGALGEVSFEILSPSPDQFDSLFDEAIAVEVRSWKREAGTALAVKRPQELFFRDYFRSACEKGEFRISFMRIGGQAVAMQMAVESLGRYWLFKIGFDESFGKCSPGTLLMLHTLSWAANRELRAYELLGSAEPWIAELWTEAQHDFVRLRLYPFNLRGAVALAGDAIDWLRKRRTSGGV